MYLQVSQTPSNTASNTPTITPTSTPCPTTSQTPTMTQTQTPTQTTTNTPTNTNTPTQTPTPNPTPTPSPTFCYQPNAYLVLDAQTGSTALNNWMLSQGSTFRGLFLNSPSTNQAIFESQMNAYISYTGFGTTTFYIEDEPIVSTTSLTHNPEQTWAGTNVWNTWFVPTCPFCEGGNWTKWNGANLTAAQYNKVFYYSGTAIPQGYYRWLTTYPFVNQRLNTEAIQTLDTLVCPPTPTPTATMTQTPSQTPTITPTATCPIFTTQYMEVNLQSCNAFKLALWNDPSFTSAANAVCDVVVSGCAYGDLGTIYCGTETILATQHQHNFNLNPVLLPGECVSAFTVNTISEQCDCYDVIYVPNGTPTPTSTPTMTQTPSVTPTMTPTATQSCCAIDILTNLSLDVEITDVTVNGSSATYVGGQPLPNTPGNGTNLCSTTAGTVDIRVSVTNTTPAQKITLTDSNGVIDCRDITGTGPSNYDFLGVQLTCGVPITILAEDGSC